jgi:methyl-accepting chemotaxis protein
VSRRALVLILATLSLVAVAVVSYARALRTELDDAGGYALTLMELRQSALKDYLETIRSELILWTDRPALRDALVELKRGWDRLPGDRTELLQRLYIDESPYPEGEKHRLAAADDGSLYSQVHNAVHPRALRFLEEHEYHEVFLFDTDGNLIYTVYKEPDFATNLSDGPWRETGLGRAFRAARDAKTEESVAFTDFEGYEPSENEPASFMASPVWSNDGAPIGVMAVQIPVGRINEIMRFTGGMGETGETYIVGEDLLMRSDSRFSDTTTILRTGVHSETVRRALAGETGVEIAEDYRGAPVLSAFGPLDFEGVRWAVMAEIDEQEVRKLALEPRRLLANVFFGLAAIAALAALLYTYLASRAERPEPWTTET